MIGVTPGVTEMMNGTPEMVLYMAGVIVKASKYNAPSPRFI